MTSFVPSVGFVSGCLLLRLDDSEGVYRRPFRCILDRDPFGDITGVEILDIRRQLDGAVVTSSTVTRDFRWSYDPDVDAFYVHIQRGSSLTPTQESCDGVALVSADNRLVSLEIPA